MYRVLACRLVARGLTRVALGSRVVVRGARVTTSPPPDYSPPPPAQIHPSNYVEYSMLVQCYHHKFKRSKVPLC